jgi:threonine dehydratase
VTLAAGTRALVSLDDITAAASRIAGIARRTPLWSATADPNRAGLWLKCENLQLTGAFKIRGAANMLRQLDRDALDRGVITYSSGNHGQAMACTARLLGAPAVVVMPTTAPAVKVEGARAYGAEVVFCGTTTIDRRLEAERIAAERGMTMVPPFDHPWVIAGQGTIGLEILEELPGVEAIYLPVGGGGLVSGVAAAVKRLQPAVRIVGVEPTGAPKMTRSLAAGHPVTLEATSSIADGLLAVRPADITFAHVAALVDEIVTVTEEEIAESVRWLAREAHQVVEPSGAVAVAAARARHAINTDSGYIVALLSGGNVAPERLSHILAGAR